MNKIRQEAPYLLSALGLTAIFAFPLIHHYSSTLPILFEDEERRGGTYLVSGSSMEPLLYDGEEVSFPPAKSSSTSSINEQGLLEPGSIVTFNSPYRELLGEILEGSEEATSEEIVSVSKDSETPYTLPIMRVEEVLSGKKGNEELVAVKEVIAGPGDRLVFEEAPSGTSKNSKETSLKIYRAADSSGEPSFEEVLPYECRVEGLSTSEEVIKEDVADGGSPSAESYRASYSLPEVSKNEESRESSDRELYLLIGRNREVSLDSVRTLCEASRVSEAGSVEIEPYLLERERIRYSAKPEELKIEKKG